MECDGLYLLPLLLGRKQTPERIPKESPIPLKIIKRERQMYLSEELDPLFRSFLQAGMARVVVTVKPGFEDAVNFYMATGKIWNGGEVPVIGDPMFLSIADELKAPVGKPQGKYILGLR